MRRKITLVLAAAIIVLFQAQSLFADHLTKDSQQITLVVDATEAPRKLFHTQLKIPASPGPMVLFYPEWIPGEHGPTGPIINLAGLKISAGDKRIEWRRDDVDMYAFHFDVPTGTDSINVSLDFLSPTLAAGFSSGASATAHLTILAWNQLLLYPQGPTISELTYKASLTLPPGWKFGTALPVARESKNKIDFAPVSLEKLVDSPVLAGEYFRALRLADRPPNEIDIAADSPAALEISPELETTLKRLVAEAVALFGATHYEHYHFLLTLSDYVAHFGLEHHECNDSRVAERAFVDKILGDLVLGVLSHEFVHSWNGKFRRPAGLTTPNYQAPMKGELLWVYEGLTQYLGNVLAARSGLWTPERYRERLAQIAADLDHRPGRGWRPLQDTAIAAQILYGSPSEWSSLRRSTDFYDEGWLVWLEADTLIRELTGGKRSLDDFCRRFHGAPSTPPMVKTYTFDDVVATLNEVAPYDWRRFLLQRLNSTDFHAPLGGIEQGGWRLVYDTKPNGFLRDAEQVRRFTELSYSVGLRLQENGTIADAIEGMAAARAGIGPGMKLIAVNSEAWSPEVLREAVRATKNGASLELAIDNDGMVKNYKLDYHDGERYPLLERDASKPDVLSEIIAPLTWRR